ncbi:phage antirepressor [Priestia abyssalis]|uniref:phage antirepressor n=1 Tax=Priestia abyssalis TaxID=1221450 RepID=UPI0009958F6D|nr:phage antirepressor [Priestia abyssalis]
MSELQLFNYGLQEVRTVVKDGEVWFVAKDVCDILEIRNVSDATSSLKPNFKTSIVLTDTGSNYKTNALIVSEAGLYKLVFKSRKKEAEKFTDWIAEEVLPSIRKHGAYMTPATIDAMVSNPDLLIRLATQLKEEQQKRKEVEQQVKKLSEENDVMEMVIAESQPKITYYDTILDSKGTMTITEIAQDYDLTAQQLNELLRSKGVQYKQGKRWILTKKHQGNGYVDSKTIHIKQGDFTKTQMRWTQKGRLFIHDILKKNGIVPIIDREEGEVLTNV